MLHTRWARLLQHIRARCKKRRRGMPLLRLRLKLTRGLRQIEHAKQLRPAKLRVAVMRERERKLKQQRRPRRPRRLRRPWRLRGCDRRKSLPRSRRSVAAPRRVASLSARQREQPPSRESLRMRRSKRRVSLRVGRCAAPAMPRQLWRTRRGERTRRLRLRPCYSYVRSKSRRRLRRRRLCQHLPARQLRRRLRLRTPLLRRLWSSRRQLSSRRRRIGTGIGPACFRRSSFTLLRRAPMPRWWVGSMAHSQRPEHRWRFA